ncbi:cobyrinic acid ac-diamide synthase [Halothece sp. PCC 7418]|uniref:MinD/ParA family ATP-binding protein n=1 Tax=Halothece sp. (strain PCC 7418) TaxID=65093 RepID=UPI0002A079FC|nr:MinD/ParA family protein [Halothece sp. PCC 7418]AFZ44807.1 cobyrinic acid ac-diamide synthase [Halothece sp. PCC 7418]
MTNIVSIHSYRGGTGKSNVTANLSAVLAKSGKRVAVVDTDIQSPGIHVLFGFDDEDIQTSLNDYVWGKLPISQVSYDVTRVLGQAKTSSTGQLYLVPSSTSTEDIARVLREGYDIEYLSEGLQALAEELNLDYLLIDTHPGLNEETLLSITISDTLVLILRPDSQDYQGTAVTVEVSRKLQVPQMFMLVNKVPTAFDLDELKVKVEETYNVGVAGLLPHSDEMMMLASSGLFTVQYPDHELNQVFESVARQIL